MIEIGQSGGSFGGVLGRGGKSVDGKELVMLMVPSWH